MHTPYSAEQSLIHVYIHVVDLWSKVELRGTYFEIHHLVCHQLYNNRFSSHMQQWCMLYTVMPIVSECCVPLTALVYMWLTMKTLTHPPCGSQGWAPRGPVHFVCTCFTIRVQCIGSGFCFPLFAYDQFSQKQAPLLAEERLERRRNIAKLAMARARARVWPGNRVFSYIGTFRAYNMHWPINKAKLR